MILCSEKISPIYTFCCMYAKSLNIKVIPLLTPQKLQEDLHMLDDGHVRQFVLLDTGFADSGVLAAVEDARWRNAAAATEACTS